jgi:hypothetical protein
MIENPKAIKTYLSMMLKDYDSANGNDNWAPLDNKLSDLEAHLPVLVQALAHYKKSSDDFLKLGKPIPRMKDIVEFYEELIVLLRENFNHSLGILLECISVGPAVALMRMDNSNRASDLLTQLDTLLFQSLISPVTDDEFDQLLSKLTAVFEEIPLPPRQLHLPYEIFEKNMEERKAIMNSWFGCLDNYWITRSLNSF